MFTEFFNAFWVGGLICVAGQILIDRTKLTPARIMVIYVLSGVFLGALGLYDPIAEFAGCGATVPLSGFGNMLAKGVRDAVDESGFTGIFSGGIGSAAAGITAALFFGLVASVFFRPKDKDQ